MNLNDLKPAPGSTKRRKRLGRGIGSGKGKTAGRGGKGQMKRRQVNPNFEGGQTPIHRRLPVKKGFRNVNHKEFAIVNLDDLQRHFSASDTVTPEALMAKGVIGELQDGLKVLGFGELSTKLTVHAHKFSKSARAAIESAGGTAEEIQPKAKAAPEAAPAE
jgi:large subunit ribosomal protein L15